MKASRNEAFSLCDQASFLLLDDVVQLLRHLVVTIASFCYDEVHEDDTLDDYSQSPDYPEHEVVYMVKVLACRNDGEVTHRYSHHGKEVSGKQTDFLVLEARSRGTEHHCTCITIGVSDPETFPEISFMQRVLNS